MIEYTKTDRVLLNIHDVSLRFGKHEVLRDVDALIVDIERHDQVQGQVICFLGPSGIGKTQLSRIIAGLQQPTSGTVTLDQDVPTRKGLVGMVPQNYPLFRFTTVWGNLMIAGRHMPLAARVSKANTLLLQLGLGDYRKYYPKDLSGGTRQRVAIARQMMCADHYLVMDEPFSGLDPIMKRKASELITQLADLDTLNTIIIVTHDITEGLGVADTVWLMGQEPDPNNPGEFLPGAKLVEQYDLAKEGLCWRPDINSDPRFIAFVADVKARFQTLKKQ